MLGLQARSVTVVLQRTAAAAEECLGVLSAASSGARTAPCGAECIPFFGSADEQGSIKKSHESSPHALCVLPVVQVMDMLHCCQQELRQVQQDFQESRQSVVYGMCTVHAVLLVSCKE